MRDVSELKDQSQSLCVESDVFEKVGNTRPTDMYLSPISTSQT